ncbi:MAG: 4-hydroxylaminobenzoate lyase [Sporichthyaceae bacterium]
MTEVTTFVGQRPLDGELQAALNERYPADGAEFGRIVATCLQAIDEGWMCNREGGGIKYGRVFKPAPEFADFSVDVVDMADVVGPHHRHPNGEIDLIMPIDPTAEFDGNGAGWMVYPADSAHPPTVDGGRALVLYLLPQGAIEFG